MIINGLDGRKLLIIGSSGAEMAIVKAAKGLGLHTICCDGITNPALSPAKQDSDEAWDIDYSKINEVAYMCRKHGVDGVMAGYSEWRVLAATKIAKAIGKPFYACEEQIELTRDKRKFKDLCVECGVPVPMDYCFDLPMKAEDYESIHYPVIVKPVDNGGRKGISVCHNQEELEVAVEYALNNSVCKRIIIEDYISGTEITALYTLKDGGITLSLLKDKYPCANYNQLCNLTLSPSAFTSEYISTVDPNVRALLKKISAENGVCFFQMIAGERGIVVFEMGYRLNGGNDYKIISRMNGENYMNMLINHSITGSMTGEGICDGNFVKDESRKLFCEMLVHCHEGTIHEIDFNRACEVEGVDEAYPLKRKGMKITDNGTTAQNCGRVVMHADSLEALKPVIKNAYNSIIINDADGRDMKFKIFDTEVLGGY